MGALNIKPIRATSFNNIKRELQKIKDILLDVEQRIQNLESNSKKIIKSSNSSTKNVVKNTTELSEDKQ